MYTFHVILLPVAVVALVAWHVLLVRRHGVVPPYPAKGRGRQAGAPEPRRRRGGRIVSGGRARLAGPG